jgi:hypothetical protein
LVTIIIIWVWPTWDTISAATPAEEDNEYGHDDVWVQKHPTTPRTTTTRLPASLISNVDTMAWNVPVILQQLSDDDDEEEETSMMVTSSTTITTLAPMIPEGSLLPWIPSPQDIEQLTFR